MPGSEVIAAREKCPYCAPNFSMRRHLIFDGFDLTPMSKNNSNLRKGYKLSTDQVNVDDGRPTIVGDSEQYKSASERFSQTVTVI